MRRARHHPLAESQLSPRTHDVSARATGPADAVLEFQHRVGNQVTAALLRTARAHGPAVQRCGAQTHEGCPCAASPAEGTVQRAPVAAVGAGAPACSTPVPRFVIDTGRTVWGLLDQLKPRVSGVTRPARVLNVETRTVRDGPDWRLCVTGVASVVHVETWLAVGEREPTVANSTEANFCEQVTNLHQVSERSSASRWYMIEATRKHERRHAAEWETAFATDWPAVQLRIESIRVPATFAGLSIDEDAATEMLRGSRKFRAAIDTTDAGGNYPTFWVEHDDATMRAIEHTVVDPRITQLCEHAKATGWKAPASTAVTGCPVCVHHGVTDR